MKPFAGDTAYCDPETHAQGEVETRSTHLEGKGAMLPATRGNRVQCL